MFKVGFVQFAPVRHNVIWNITRLQNLLSGVRCDLLVLPELANSGYLYSSTAEMKAFAEPADGSGEFLSTMKDLAGKMGGVIVAGYAEQAAEGLYNSAAAVSADGVLQNYRKTHLFGGEKKLFLPGNTGFNLFEHCGVRIGILVCFDWIFPEAARSLALKGAHILAHPTNLVLPYCQSAMVTRSLENHVFSITANRYGSETLANQVLNFSGASQVIDPQGNRLLQAAVDQDSIQVCEIEPALAENKRINAENDLFADRHPEFYLG
jgi:predicted amidohydrolase